MIMFATTSLSSCATILLTITFHLNMQGETSAFSVLQDNQATSRQRSVPSSVPNVQIELPDFDVLFDNIRELSPLTNMMISECQNSSVGEYHHGFAVADEMYASPLKWKRVESNKNAVVKQIDKIDNFKDRGCPIFRFRSSLEGPCVGMKFVEYIMDFEERSLYDPQIEVVEQRYPAYDMASANIAMDFKYGETQLLGIGYTKTKPFLVVDGREQLTLCGVQQFSNGGCNIWGIELDERHNHLFPDCERHVRATSHVLSITLVPTGRNSFDVEYVLQLEVGGNLPNFITTPIMIDTVKAMFKQAKSQYSNEMYMTHWINSARKNQTNDEMIKERLGLLMTP